MPKYTLTHAYSPDRAVTDHLFDGDVHGDPDCRGVGQCARELWLVEPTSDPELTPAHRATYGNVGVQ